MHMFNVPPKLYAQNKSTPCCVLHSEEARTSVAVTENDPLTHYNMLNLGRFLFINRATINSLMEVPL